MDKNILLEGDDEEAAHTPVLEEHRMRGHGLIKQWCNAADTVVYIQQYLLFGQSFPVLPLGDKSLIKTFFNFPEL